MKLGWYWTTATSAFQHFTSSNLIQPSSPSYMLPSHAMELSSEPEWLLLQILGWKARPICPFGQAIELWVCVQRCVCVGGLTWSRWAIFWHLQQAGVNNAKKVESELKKDKDHMRGSLCKSISFTFVPFSEHSATSFLPSNFSSPRS